MAVQYPEKPLVDRLCRRESPAGIDEQNFLGIGRRRRRVRYTLSVDEAIDREERAPNAAG